MCGLGALHAGLGALPPLLEGREREGVLLMPLLSHSQQWLGQVRELVQPKSCTALAVVSPAAAVSLRQACMCEAIAVIWHAHARLHAIA